MPVHRESWPRESRSVNRDTPGKARSLHLVGAALIVVFLVACGADSEPSGNVAQAPGGNNTVRLVTDNTAFIPETLDLEAGAKVTVEITNQDDTPHDFAIEGLNVNTGTIMPGEIASATFSVPGETTEFVCTFHPGMRGRIDVS